MDRRSGLWGQIDYRFSKSYLEAQETWFGPQVSGADFLGDYRTARDTVRDWFEEPYYSDINSMTRLVLAQESRLDGYWPSTLDALETFTGRFAPLSGSEQTWAEMVRLTGRLDSAQGEDYQAYRIPLSGADLSFLMIVPAEGAFDAVKARMDRPFLQTLLSQLAAEDTSVAIPKAELRTYGWPAQIPSLGDALSRETADFSGVNGQGYLFLHKPGYKVSLSLRDPGVSTYTQALTIHEATPDEPASLFNGHSSAGSIMSLMDSSWGYKCYYPPDQRSFLFLVYDDQTGTLLNTGQVTKLLGDTVSPDWTSYSPCGDSADTADTGEFVIADYSNQIPYIEP